MVLKRAQRIASLGYMGPPFNVTIRQTWLEKVNCQKTQSVYRSGAATEARIRDLRIYSTVRYPLRTRPFWTHSGDGGSEGQWLALIDS